MDFHFIIAELTISKIKEMIIKYNNNQAIVKLLTNLVELKRIQQFTLLQDEQLLLSEFVFSHCNQQLDDIIYRLTKKGIIDSNTEWK
jgi:tyrosine-protein phosphatase YwqE